MRNANVVLAHLIRTKLIGPDTSREQGGFRLRTVKLFRGGELMKSHSTKAVGTTTMTPVPGRLKKGLLPGASVRHLN